MLLQCTYMIFHVRICIHACVFCGNAVAYVVHVHTVYSPESNCIGLNMGRVDYLYGSSVFLILISLLYLAVEAVQVVRRRHQYFKEGENYIQVLTFVFSIVFVSGFGNECWCAPSWQWQFGALALFLAWFNLIILLKDMPFTGIPINMLFNICLTFVSLVFLPFYSSSRLLYHSTCSLLETSMP